MSKVVVKRFLKKVNEFVLFNGTTISWVLIIGALVLVMFFDARPPATLRAIDASDLNYFRDDSAQLCFAYVRRPDFQAMIEIDCGRVRW